MGLRKTRRFANLFGSTFEGQEELRALICFGTAVLGEKKMFRKSVSEAALQGWDL